MVAHVYNQLLEGGGKTITSSQLAWATQSNSVSKSFLLPYLSVGGEVGGGENQP